MFMMFDRARLPGFNIRDILRKMVNGCRYYQREEHKITRLFDM